MHIHNPSPFTPTHPTSTLEAGSPRRNARYEDEPGLYQSGKVWLYGNSRLFLSDLVCIESCFEHPGLASATLFEAIETAAERAVLSGKTIVCGMHNELHRRAAIVPLRWGAPRVMVFPGGFYYHLGKDLHEEPFRAARLWRYQWDARTDLAVSRRAPDKLPTYALYNPSVDRLIRGIAMREIAGFSSFSDPFGPRV